MYRRIVSFLFLVVLLSLVQSTHAQIDTLPVRISGVITSADTLLSTPYVHVINKRTGAGVISDAEGVFRIKILPRDTLIFSCVGFKDFMYVFPDSMDSKVRLLNIELSETSYNLDVIDIFALGRKNQVKYDILNMAPEKDEWAERMIMPGFNGADYQWIRESEKISGAQPFNPFKAIGYAMGKDVRDLSKLERLMEQDVKDAVVDKKYNRTLLENFTNYHASKLDCFTMYLKLDYDFLFNENGYEIFSEVKRRMIPFEFQYNNDSLTMLRDFRD